MYVAGERLDVARTDIKKAGLDNDVKVLGGGLFGVIVDSDWVVCHQSPAAGQPMTDVPQLTVDRSCANGASTSASPSTSASRSESSPTATTSDKPIAKGPITAPNNKDFAALLADPSADCDNKPKAFARKYWNKKIEFNGRIANMMLHGNDKYLWDILITIGKGVRGPDFKFDGVNIQPGWTGGMNLPANSAMPEQGDKVHVVAGVDNYDQKNCSFFLDPVATKILR